VKIHFWIDTRWRTAPKLDILNHNNSNMDCSISLKFGTWVKYEFTKAAELLKLRQVYYAPSE